jgi:hypothetical protein
MPTTLPHFVNGSKSAVARTHDTHHTLVTSSPWPVNWQRQWLMVGRPWKLISSLSLTMCSNIASHHSRNAIQMGGSRLCRRHQRQCRRRLRVTELGEDCLHDAQLHLRRHGHCKLVMVVGGTLDEGSGGVCGVAVAADTGDDGGVGSCRIVWRKQLLALVVVGMKRICGSTWCGERTTVLCTRGRVLVCTNCRSIYLHCSLMHWTSESLLSLYCVSSRRLLFLLLLTGCASNARRSANSTA